MMHLNNNDLGGVTLRRWMMTATLLAVWSCTPSDPGNDAGEDRGRIERDAGRTDVSNPDTRDVDRASQDLLVPDTRPGSDVVQRSDRAQAADHVRPQDARMADSSTSDVYQAFDAGPGTTRPIISEIFYNAPETSENNFEWFEIYNPGSTALNISGYVVQSGTQTKPRQSSVPVVAPHVPAGGYAVLAKTADLGVGCQLTSVVLALEGDFLLSNSSGGARLAIYPPDTVDFDDLHALDLVSYRSDGFPPSTSGVAIRLHDMTGDNGVAANWSLAQASGSGCSPYWTDASGDHFGTPGHRNSWCDVAPLCAGTLDAGVHDTGTADVTRPDAVADDVVVSDLAPVAICNNGTVEPGETCDPPDTCPTACNDGDPCTLDELLGSAELCTATCSAPPITTCGPAEGCCPASCNPVNDVDCAPQCLDDPCLGGGTSNDCCPGATYCTGAEPVGRTCRSSCGAEGEGCSYNGDCCQGLRCLAGSCLTVSADCAGNPCEAGDDCCSATSRCVGLFGATQLSCQGQCGQDGDHCYLDADCCGGLLCLTDTCRSTEGYHWRTSWNRGAQEQSRFFAPASAQRVAAHVRDPGDYNHYYIYDPRGEYLHDPYPLTYFARGWTTDIPGREIIVSYGNAGGLIGAGSRVDGIRYLIADTDDPEPWCSMGEFGSVRTGYTEDLDNNYAGSCVGESYPEAIYRFVAPAAGVYTFHMIDDQFNGLYVRRGDCDGVELGCATHDDPVHAPLQAGEAAYVFIDSLARYDDSTGYFWAEVELCEPLECSTYNYTCGSGSDHCGDTLECGSCTEPEVCSGGEGLGRCCKPSGVSCFTGAECCNDCVNLVCD